MGVLRATLSEEYAHLAASLVSSFKAICLAIAQPPGCYTCPGSSSSVRQSAHAHLRPMVVMLQLLTSHLKLLWVCLHEAELMAG